MIQPEFDAAFGTYLLVVAHPDDSEFGAGGTVARLTDNGVRVVVVQVTSGNKGSADRTADPREVAKTREAELRVATRQLGVTEVVFLRCMDGELEPNLDLREKIVRVIRRYQPDVIITHDPFRPYALHPDHRAVGLATTDAVYPTARDPLYFSHHLSEGLEPHKTAEIWYFGAEHPDRFIDIASTFSRKIEALKAHVSQISDAKDLEARLRERAEELAAPSHFTMAEAFKVIQMRR